MVDWIQANWISLLAAFGSGSIFTAIIGAEVKWLIENRSERLNARRKLLDNLSAWIDRNETELVRLSGWVTFQTKCDYYRQIRPYLDKKMMARVDDLTPGDFQKDLPVEHDDGSMPVNLDYVELQPNVVLKEEVARLERRWRLI